ncbi:DNA methyltransferase [Mesorhizobium sp. M2D.F.Ca.ET.171.01.1.1]|uniref:type ISP restriction/modification enzyme n=1 Tax=unclassified Mesorhizobium TaxID=325217 RepID=UPI001091F1DF|nr:MULTISPECIES: type ISP restriction/modification enzyme [unclassified Mesorhizobium]TGS97478.1 DNA methyltransferase [Mesorhizobium sp. M2D.F.Ca.ET.178.01.1.1]TGT12048.1 DNA methyltransferase [Mesorhizobium sp. M2D.F.Ca.ET.171.01.1.1]
MSDRLIQIVERYFARLRDERGLGTGTKERSYYPALADLLNAIGQELKPKVICLSDLANTGAGHPDFGLYAANQVQKGEPRKGQPPERGVIEMKGVADETWLTAETKQVSKYFGAYRLVIVSNLRDFLIIGEGQSGEATKLERFRLASNAKSFWDMVAEPRKSAEEVGRAFGEYLKRALTQSVALREPRDVAWFLASYARDALQRVEGAGDLPALANVRSSLEQALGVTFDPEKGNHFFRSTLVQTLFYGVFSAWVIWARQIPKPSVKFDWKLATWHLTVPFIRTLFQQIASPTHLQPLKLVEVLDWTAATLNRVETDEFFKRFNDTDAVQFFYEPFLQAFDPELRRELGVWYTPVEVVEYMVARVDKALRDDLGIEDGLASERVYILDPCCGTGAFLSAILKRIESSLDAKGLGDLKGDMVKKAALSRVFGFEIMPAPFVISHLQIGLTLQAMGADLSGNSERAGIYLTNALTGWEPHVTKPLPFPELEDERSRADRVKQEAPILVVIGNPPYNGFAGVTVGPEERALTEAYKRPRKVRRPEGQGLNDLYVRFFRMAERRIVQKLTIERADLLSDTVRFHYEDAGSGIVCFISNYSWLDGLSFTAMRERYLEAYDAIRIDCLNGDRFRTGKTTPEGKPDPSIFSTEHNREGIQVGTAIATLIRKDEHEPSPTVAFRNLWGVGKRQELLDTADVEPAALYQTITPQLELGLPFIDTALGSDYFNWISIPDLLPTSFPGVKTSRDEFLVDVDIAPLKERLATYFDSGVSNEAVRSRFAQVMAASDRYDPVETRAMLLKRGLSSDGFVRYAYRPFDVRWLYWEPETKLLDEKRAEYWPHVFDGNLALSAQQKPRGEWQSSQIVGTIACLDLIDRGSSNFPMRLLDPQTGEVRSNVAGPVLSYLKAHSIDPEAAFFNALAILHAPKYRLENKDALRMDWPRVPLSGDDERLSNSAKLGKEVSVLLNPDTPAHGVTAGMLRVALRVLALPTKLEGTTLNTSLTARWGYSQIDRKTGNRKTMAGPGLTKQRDYTPAERTAFEKEADDLGVTLAELLGLIGDRAVDVYLNNEACWSCVPSKVWDYTLGGYQVIKKWLSYRESDVLGRALTIDEVSYVSQMVRRIAAVLMMGPALDANYHASAQTALAYADVGLSRDAARERREAKTIKRGLGDTRHEAVKKVERAAKKEKRGAEGMHEKASR